MKQRTAKMVESYLFDWGVYILFITGWLGLFLAPQISRWVVYPHLAFYTTVWIYAIVRGIVIRIKRRKRKND